MTSLIHVQGLKGTIIMKQWECILVYEIRTLEYNISNFPSFNRVYRSQICFPFIL